MLPRIWFIWQINGVEYNGILEIKNLATEPDSRKMGHLPYGGCPK